MEWSKAETADYLCELAKQAPGARRLWSVEPGLGSALRGLAALRAQLGPRAYVPWASSAPQPFKQRLLVRQVDDSIRKSILETLRPGSRGFPYGPERPQLHHVR